MGRMVESDAGKTRFRSFLLVLGTLDVTFFPSLTSNTKAAIVFVFGDEDVLINQRMSLKRAARAE